MVGLGTNSVVSGLGLSPNEEQKQDGMQTKGQPLDEHTAHPTTPTGPPTAGRHKTQGHSREYYISSSAWAGLL